MTLKTEKNAKTKFQYYQNKKEMNFVKNITYEGQAY